MKKTLLLLLAILFAASLQAQMISGTDTLYGNEWIDFSRAYYRIPVPEDGIYRLAAQTLDAAGFPLQSVPGYQFRLYHNGKEVPAFASSDGLFGPNDFLEFYGQKNRSEIDRYLFDHPDDEMLNPYFSMFTDTAAYYLGWSETGTPLRIQNIINDLSNLPPPEPFCWFTLEKIFSSSYFKRQISSELTWSWFNGEGFHRGSAPTSPIGMNPKKLYAGGPYGIASVRYACNLGAHQQRVRMTGVGPDSVFYEDQFDDFKLFHYTFRPPMNLLGAQTKIVVEGANLNDKHALSAVFLKYPRLFDAENAGSFAFELDSSADARYFELSAFNSTGGVPLLYDLNNGFRMNATVENNLVKVKLPPASKPRKILLINPVTQVKNVENLRLQTFHDFKGDDAEYIILSNPALYSDPENGGINHVAEYAAYRQSPQGGSYKVVTVDVNELYEQFSYGARYHPLAVRNFTHWAKKHWSNPRFLLLIGKGLNYDLLRDPAAASALTDSIFYLPAFGNPGSDQLFMTGNAAEAPIFAIGRLAVTRPAEIGHYLDKIKEYEANNDLPQTIDSRLWMKRVLHLSGGSGSGAVSIKDAIETMRPVLEQGRFGAEVTTLYKTSSDPVQLSGYQRILNMVNSGTALLTLVGHSSAQVLDFDIGEPEDYNNKGRYPVLATFGCFSGTCSLPAKGLGERFVLTPDRGAIAFFAFANYGFLESLRKFGVAFYQQLGGPGYGKTIGEQLAEATRSLEGNADLGLVAVMHQMVLQGDPALRIYAAPGPDFIIDPQSVKFNPNPIGIDQGTYTLDFDVVNIGENAGGNITLAVEQRLPNDTLRTVVTEGINAPALRQKMHYVLPAPGREAIGFNRFFIKADTGNDVAELPLSAETNNELEDNTMQKGVNVFCYADDVMPLYPAPFGIVPKQNVVLKASTFNFSAPVQRYLFEIDTTPAFNSPVKKAGQIVQRGGLLQWPVPIQMADSTVYYWRVARDSLVNGAVVWRNNSFVYLPGSQAGWNQSHFYQFGGNTFFNLGLDTLNQRWAFPDNASFLAVTADYFSVGRYPGIQNIFYEGFTGYGGFIVRKISKGGVVLALIDPLTGRFVPNPIGSPTNPDPTQSIHFHYFNTNDSLKRLLLMDFLQHQIPDGYYAGLLTLKNPASDTLGFSPEKWGADSLSYGKNIFQLLEAQGARKVRALATSGSKPYAFIFRQNDPLFAAVDTIVYSQDSAVEIRRNFFAKWSGGQMESARIGPAKAWSSLHWQRGLYDDPGEKVLLSVIGVKEGQPDSLLFTVENTFDTALANISVAQFPYLKLRIAALDTVRRSMPAIGKLRILFDPLPEGALNPAAGYTFYRDTLFQGEQMKTGLVFENISETGMDSLLVKFRVEDEANSGTEIVQKHKTLPPGDTLWAKLDFDTRHISGKQRLSIEVNPGNAQPELYHFNNVAFREFYVQRDLRNPLLDVTFDGYHLLDGDLVSPKPEIVASLKDENRYLALTDTATISLSLVYPGGLVKKISWNDPQVLFFPANSAQKNLARLEFRPEFKVDGKYQLRVNGRDASGNPSGTLDYTINFKVITRSTFGNLLNYPNPFSSSTRFVYTLTGAEMPANFKIQIMTVSGRVVREITGAEFGPMRAGVHQSDFSWDGADQYGDRLANGVYLYRVVAKKADGSDFEFLPNNQVDGFFNNGFGKMVLAR